MTRELTADEEDIAAELAPLYACACGWQGSEPSRAAFLSCPKCGLIVTFGTRGADPKRAARAAELHEEAKARRVGWTR